MFFTGVRTNGPCLSATSERLTQKLCNMGLMARLVENKPPVGNVLRNFYVLYTHIVKKYLLKL